MTTETRKGIVATALKDRLQELRIHMVIAHKDKPNEHCQYADPMHWNTELDEITNELRILESSSSSQDSLKAVRAKITYWKKNEQADRKSGYVGSANVDRTIIRELEDVLKIIAMKSPSSTGAEKVE